MFNIILPKPCEIFAKCLLYVQYYFTQILWNLCQIFGKSLTIIWFNQYNSVNVGRMIYFRENSNVCGLFLTMPSGRSNSLWIRVLQLRITKSFCSYFLLLCSLHRTELKFVSQKLFGKQDEEWQFFAFFGFIVYCILLGLFVVGHRPNAKK